MSTQSIRIPQTTTTYLHQVSPGSLGHGLNAVLPVEQVGTLSLVLPHSLHAVELIKETTFALPDF